MPLYKLNVKWQKERYKDVVCNTDDTPQNFKAILFSLTGVPPERQKVMMPGKILGDDNFEGIKLRDGATIMMIGTVDELPKVEDTHMAVEESGPVDENTIVLPFGLVNLGNTCYMNAAIEVLYSVPEIRAALQASPNIHTSSDMNSREALAANLRLLFKSLSEAKQPVIPFIFVTCLRNVCPQFATRLSNDDEKDSAGNMMSLVGGRFAQQDANECWVELMHVLQCVKLDPRTTPQLQAPINDSTLPWNPVEKYFTGRLSCKMTCTEVEGEEPGENEETFTQLSCFINQEVKFLHTGLRNGFEGSVTKNSPTLGRDAVYKKTSVVTRLPAYLSIHFVRFFYKEDKHINAKILKDVKFPLELDMFSFCSESLQRELQPMREKMRLAEDQAAQKLPKNEKLSEKFKKQQNPAKNPELFEPYSLSRDPGSNNSGYYELMGVVTHQGRTSSSGHYVSWVKVDGNWMKFDDDVVTCVTPEDILRLSGGGDWHCAYVLLYGPKRVLKNVPSNNDAAGTDVPLESGAVVDLGSSTLGGDRRAK